MIFYYIKGSTFHIILHPYTFFCTFPAISAAYSYAILLQCCPRLPELDLVSCMGEMEKAYSTLHMVAK